MLCWLFQPSVVNGMHCPCSSTNLLAYMSVVMHIVVLASLLYAIHLPISGCLHAGDRRAHSRPSTGCMDISGRFCAQPGSCFKGRRPCQVSSLPGTGPAGCARPRLASQSLNTLAHAGLLVCNSGLQMRWLPGSSRSPQQDTVLISDQMDCCGRDETLDAEHCKHLFARLLTSVLPLLKEHSYNGTDSEEDPVAASPLASSAKDCLQAVCNLLGPQAYIGIAAQLFLDCQSTGTEGVHLAEVTETPPYSFQLLPSLSTQFQKSLEDSPLDVKCMRCACWVLW